MGLSFTHPLGWGHACCRPPAPHLASVCLQDEVAHTVTESRVLQNTRHPFLTVSGTPSGHAHGILQASPLDRLREPAQPCCWGAQLSVGRGLGQVLLGSPGRLNQNPRGGSCFLDNGVLSAPQTTGEVTLQGPRRAGCRLYESEALSPAGQSGNVIFCFYLQCNTDVSLCCLST